MPLHHNPPDTEYGFTDFLKIVRHCPKCALMFWPETNNKGKIARFSCTYCGMPLIELKITSIVDADDYATSVEDSDKPFREAPNGLYYINWKDDIQSSLAAIGRDKKGKLWYHPTNWVSGPSNDWTNVRSIKLIMRSVNEIHINGMTILNSNINNNEKA